jgi:hypothetical protein
MKTLLAVVLLVALTQPAASACRHFSIWRYSYPQPPCPVAAPEGVIMPSAQNIPLPDLTHIVWGEDGDVRLVAAAKLRALSGDR